MKTLTKRIVAIGGSTLMLAGMAAPAMAQGEDRRDRDRGSRPGECTVELDQTRRGNDLEVTVDGSRRADNAIVRLNFERNRGRDVSQWLRIDLDRRGDGDVSVDIPRRANSVDATVYIREGRRGGFVTCDATLDLDRRGGGGPRNPV